MPRASTVKPAIKPGDAAKIVERVRTGDDAAFKQFVKAKRRQILDAKRRYKRYGVTEEGIVREMWHNIARLDLRPVNAVSAALAAQHEARKNASYNMREARRREAEKRYASAPDVGGVLHAERIDRKDAEKKLEELVASHFKKSHPMHARKYTRIFMHYYFGGHGLTEIATRFGIRHAGSIDQIVKRATKYLKEDPRFRLLAAQAAGLSEEPPRVARFRLFLPAASKMDLKENLRKKAIEMFVSGTSRGWVCRRLGVTPNQLKHWLGFTPLQIRERFGNAFILSLNATLSSIKKGDHNFGERNIDLNVYPSTPIGVAINYLYGRNSRNVTVTK